MSSFPTFAEFYRAANGGRSPFPWQSRLAELARRGDWPSEIGIPTGLGKTSCIDIAVWALASAGEASPAERTIPTRIWWVVNRRLLVDAAFDRGERLTRLLADPASLHDEWPAAAGDSVEAVEAVARGLGAIGSGVSTRQLHIARLRGGTELGSRCPDPSQPSILFATVPMLASRWLFRGYGTSVGMRPVDAALTGADSLVLLDEAHLARPLLSLGDTVAACDLGDPSVLLNPGRCRPRLVALTATGESMGDRFDLDGADLSQPLVAQRVHASKPTSLREVAAAKDLPRGLADAAISLFERREGSACVVFCNTVAVARATWDLLRRKLADRSDVLLVTGRAREREAARLRARLLDPNIGAPAAGPLDARARSLVVVATQTLEVGADLDFDFLVTQSAGVRALTQRFGRLNRLGQRRHAEAVICHVADGTDPLYGDEPAAVWARLRKTTTLDLAPAHAASILGEPNDGPPRTGTLLPIHLWELSKTSSPPPEAAPPEVFFEPIDEEVRDVSICWRAHVPDDGSRLWPAVFDNECVDVPIGEIRRALAERSVGAAPRLARDGGTIETVTPSVLVPGDRVILPITVGLYDEYGWNLDATANVLDVATLERQYLPLDLEAIFSLLDEAAVEGLHEVTLLIDSLRNDDGELEREDEASIVGELLQRLRVLRPRTEISPEEWTSLLTALAPQVHRPVDDVPFLRFVRHTRDGPRTDLRIDALEELSFDLTSTDLFDHVRNVGDLAARIGARIGLPSQTVEALRFAGYFHDLGKADPRFQAWLRPDGGEGLLAKSSRLLSEVETRRVASGWPRGGRHELLSVRILDEWLAHSGPVGWDPDLVRHLIATHHGHGRPLIPVVEDAHPSKVLLTAFDIDVGIEADLSRTDFGQARIFRQQTEAFGVWGLALLEAIVRQADHLVSWAAEVP